MRALAAEPNVVSKLSGLGTFIHRNDPEHIAWIVGETVALFGARRCLYGSNFPIEKLWTDYSALIEAYRAAIADFDEVEQRAMMHDTAARVYGSGKEARPLQGGKDRGKLDSRLHAFFHPFLMVRNPSR